MRAEKRKRPISVFAWVCTALFLIILCVFIISKHSYEFADLINGTVSAWYRTAMARITSFIPFSLYELVLITIPLQVIVLGWLAIRRFKSGQGRVRFVLNLLSFALLLYGGHLLALGIGYNTTPLANKMNIPYVEINEQTLSETMISLRDEANELSEGFSKNENGSTDSGYTLDEISEKICEAYASFSKEHGFVKSFESRAKGIAFSGGMSYLGLGGIYTFYTGEANVNMKYPDYDVIFSTAHELSHQRGIMRENEANFMAYLVLSGSSDPYLRYSAALSMYSYVASALYQTSPDKYYEIAGGLSSAARGDLATSSAVSEKYGDTFIADISRAINDLYLKSSGTDGVVSYGLVTRLAVAYHYNDNRKSKF